MRYDPGHISKYYDEYGEREWERFEKTPANMVNFHIHLYYLKQFIRSGDFVLEAGAGPGRFTIELAKLGAYITVGDISKTQLNLNREKVSQAGYENQVARRELLDIVDLSQFPSQSFDAVVCYGGVLSYVFDEADRAIAEMLRVTKPGGYVLLSVMSLLGSTIASLPGILQIAKQSGLESVQNVMDTGNLVGDISNGHHCRMYRWENLKKLLSGHRCKIKCASAANFLSTVHEDALREVIAHHPGLWKRFLEWEIEFSKQPGAIDSGTHMIVVLERI